MKKVSLLFIMLMLIGSFGFGQVICQPDAADYNTGSTDGTVFTQTSMIRTQASDAERGWARFNTSAIPDGSAINSVELNIYVSDDNYAYFDVMSIEADPLLGTALGVFDDIGDGTQYAHYASNFPDPGWYVVDLGATAAGDLQALLGDDWFSVGLYEYESGSYYLEYDGWNEANPPFVSVTYSAGPDFIDEGFETWLPAGWSEDIPGAWMQGDGTIFGPGSAYEGNYAAMFYNPIYPVGAAASLITPTIDISGVFNPQLSFYWWNNDVATDPATLDVYTSVDGVAFDFVETIDTWGSGMTSWVKYETSIGNNVTKIKVTATSDRGDFCTYVDKFVVEEGPFIINSLPYAQGFDDEGFPPLGWLVAKTGGTSLPGLWERVTTGNFPAIAPHSGAGMAKFASWSFGTGNASILVTPVVDVLLDFYQVDFWMYRDGGYLSNADLVNVYVNDSPDMDSPLLLGTINRSSSLAPTVGADGWYEYFFDIDNTTKSVKYVVFEAISAWGNNMYVDDVTVQEIPPKGILAGVVTDTYTTMPIENAMVQIDEADFTVYTDEFGAYSIELTAGAYNVSISAEGYEPSGSIPVEILSELTTTLDVDLMPLPVFDPLTLVQSIDMLEWAPVVGNLADGFNMLLDPAVEYYYIDCGMETMTNVPLDLGYYDFYLDTLGISGDFFTYWADKGVVEGATGWQGMMWTIIVGDEPMIKVLVSENKEQNFMLVDGLQFLLGQGDQHLRVNGDYPLGTYTFTGDIASGETDVINPISLLFTFFTPYNLPFVEGWDSESFDTQQWSVAPDLGNWGVYTSNGNPAPCARFYWLPAATDYASNLQSFFLNGAGDKIFVQFDLYLSNYSTSTLETLSFMVYDGLDWQLIETFDNQAGSFPFTTLSYDISAYAANNVFRIGFLAEGEDVYSINYWYLDNILVYAPGNIAGTVTEDLSKGPIEGCLVEAGAYSTFTLADGSYELDAIAGDYDVTFTATGYNSLTVAGVAVVAAGTTTVDAELTAPTLEVDPVSISDVLYYKQTSSHEVTITNNGNGPLNWSAEVVYDDKGKDNSVPKPMVEVAEGLTENSNSSVSKTPSNIDGVMLWDQTGNPTTYGIVSSELALVEPDGRVLTADDFVVPAGETWVIDYVYTEGFMSASAIYLPDAFIVDFFADDNGLPGALISTESVVPGDINPATQDLYLGTPVTLAAGRYWLSVSGYFESGTLLAESRWNWYQETVLIEEEGALQDYASFFGLPAGWYYFSQIGVSNPSCRFQLMGDIEVGDMLVNLSAVSGTIDAGGSETIQVGLNAGAMPPGIYTPEIVFTSEEGVPDAIVDVTLEILGAQVMVPGAGQWGYVSTYVDLDATKMDLETAMADILADMTIMISENGLFWPSQNINSIGDWDTYAGYKIKMASNGVLVFLAPDVTDMTVTFDAGTHIIPVLNAEAVPVDDVLGVHGDAIEFAFDMEFGGVYWPAGGISTLTELKPGYGYLVKFNAETTLDFDVLIKSSPEVIIPTFENKTSWNNVVKTGDVHMISFPQNALDVLEVNDYIGAFNPFGVCMGMIQYTGTDNAMVVYGDDMTTGDYDGMADGEMISFRIFRDGEEFDLNAVYNTSMPNHDGLYASNGLSQVMELKLGETSIEENPLSHVAIYPNPSSGVFNIDLGSLNNVNIVVMNAQGQIIFSDNVTSQQIDLSNHADGVYFIKLIGEESVRLQKVIKK
nr:carboxypeptidase regulatory-like domain-containing protein [Bacteroidota bacterium]